MRLATSPASSLSNGRGKAALSSEDAERLALSAFLAQPRTSMTNHANRRLVDENAPCRGTAGLIDFLSVDDPDRRERCRADASNLNALRDEGPGDEYRLLDKLRTSRWRRVSG
jgi:hypothetical protein